MDWNQTIGDSTLGELALSLAIYVVLWTVLTMVLFKPLIVSKMRIKHSLMIRIRIFLGQKYLLNKASGEIHLLTNSRKQCYIKHIRRKNRLFLTSKQMHRLRIRGIYNGGPVNGCRWCLGRFDTDRRSVRHG